MLCVHVARRLQALHDALVAEKRKAQEQLLEKRKAQEEQLLALKKVLSLPGIQVSLAAGGVQCNPQTPAMWTRAFALLLVGFAGASCDWPG